MLATELSRNRMYAIELIPGKIVWIFEAMIALPAIAPPAATMSTAVQFLGRNHSGHLITIP